MLFPYLGTILHAAFTAQRTFLLLYTQHIPADPLKSSSHTKGERYAQNTWPPNTKSSFPRLTQIWTNSRAEWEFQLLCKGTRNLGAKGIEGATVLRGAMDGCVEADPCSHCNNSWGRDPGGKDGVETRVGWSWGMLEKGQHPYSIRGIWEYQGRIGRKRAGNTREMIGYYNLKA